MTCTRPASSGSALEVVVGLGVDVDDEAAAPFGLERQQLGGDRLARPQRAGQQHRRRPARPRRLGDVELHRPQPAAHRAADQHAALAARQVRADRHQRAELLDRQHVGVVAHRAAVRARQVIQEQRRLQPQRPVQRHRPEAVRSASTRRSSSSRDGAPTASEIAVFSSGGCSWELQVGVELARELAVLLGVKRQRAVRRGQLLGERVVGVDDPPAHPRHRVADCRSSARAPRSRPGSPPPQAARTTAPRVPGNSDSSGSAPSASIA